MKYAFILLSFFNLTQQISGQIADHEGPFYVNGIHLDSLDVHYIDVSAIYTKFLSTEISICIDYGLSRKLFSNIESILKDGNENILKFNSSIHIINFMVKQGFEYVDTHIQIDSGSSTSIYKFRKKRPN